MENNNKTLYFAKTYLPKSNKTNSLDNLNVFLENEKQHNMQDNWSKLNKTSKLMKLYEFSDMYAGECEELDKDELKKFLKDCLDKKKLGRVKDVVYDKHTGVVSAIHGLVYYKHMKKFSLRSGDLALDTTRKQCVQNS